MTEGLNDAISYIILTLVILIFLVVFAIYFKGCGTKNPINDNLISAKNTDLKAEATLMNLLRTEINDKTVSDMFIGNYAVLELQFQPSLSTTLTGKDVNVLKNLKDYEDIENLLKEIADKTEDGKKVQLSVNYPDYPNLLYGDYYSPDSVTDTSVYVSLPLPDGKIFFVHYTVFTG